MSLTHIGDSLFELLTNNQEIKVYQIELFDFNCSYNKKSYVKLFYKNLNKNLSATSVIIDTINIGEIIINKLLSYIPNLLITREYSLSNYSYNLNNLPSELKKLKIVNINLPMDNLPTNLYFLEINGEYNNNLDNLPSSLKILILEKYIKNLDDLPSSLESLSILCDYSLPIKNLPIGLKNFVFKDDSNSNLNLPSNIQNVWFDDSNNKLRRKLLKINPNVCYHDINSISIDIEIFDDIIKENKLDNIDNLSENSDSDNSDNSDDSDEYNDGDNFNHNVIIDDRIY
jgi:hypothetical protein